MKSTLLLSTILFSLPLFAHEGIPDIPPDSPGQAYQSELQRLASPPGGMRPFDGLDAILQMGERNLDWLKHMNSKRNDAEKISFTSKDTQIGYPIDSANEYSPSLIQARFTQVAADLPLAMREIIVNGQAFTDSPPVALEVYIEQGRKFDRVYQSAARWRMMQGWLGSLEGRRYLDIRGFYFLSRMPEREAALRNYSALDTDLQRKVREWLIGLCANDRTPISRCARSVDGMIAQKQDMNSFYESKRARGAAIYADFFTIPAYAVRSDFSWKGNRLWAPFQDPGSDDVRAFLQVNIQDEWRWEGGGLDLPLSRNPANPYVVFEPGVTPNVNGLGGSRITMNASQPITEYDAQWTIRHEYGHVLGFPDCYVEYYDRERGVIVNYQIDVDNIMCSRKGRVKPETVLELKRAYR